MATSTPSGIHRVATMYPQCYEPKVSREDSSRKAGVQRSPCQPPERMGPDVARLYENLSLTLSLDKGFPCRRRGCRLFRSPTLSFEAMVRRIRTGKIENNFSLHSQTPKLKCGKEAESPRLMPVGSEPRQARAQTPQLGWSEAHRNRRHNKESWGKRKGRSSTPGGPPLLVPVCPSTFPEKISGCFRVKGFK